ncbi:hypothetical protein [Synechococcus sp. CCY 9618]|uniref:hypothetical protein n=1 Tax=Synechococcus sp. CCY 9618 TaxID=2815602 RepID=UPI001C240E44|nr:hypothetical protein [Synechococcus sp. CCY 9618]
MANDADLYGSLTVINNNDTSPITFGTSASSRPAINGKPFNPTRLGRFSWPLPVLVGVLPLAGHPGCVAG